MYCRLVRGDTRSGSFLANPRESEVSRYCSLLVVFVSVVLCERVGDCWLALPRDGLSLRRCDWTNKGLRSNNHARSIPFTYK